MPIVHPPVVEVCPAFSSPKVVITARYSGRLSRMLLWDTSTDVVESGQWLKARLYQLDLSPTADFFAYFVESFHKPVNSYMAVSRPPFLTALAFWPVFHLIIRDAFFRPGGKAMEWYGQSFDPTGWSESRKPPHSRIEPGCPFQILATDLALDKGPVTQESARKHAAISDTIANLSAERLKREERRLKAIPAVEGFGALALSILKKPQDAERLLPPGAPKIDLRSDIVWDNRGRLIVCHNGVVTAYDLGRKSGKVIVDLNDRAFREVETPDWAKTWTEVRP